MCGICGIVNFNGNRVKPANIEQMMNLIKHRGPDDEGFFIHKNVGLGNVRLSIIDLTPAGHQPMFSPGKRYCLIYNGEVYNYLELKEMSAYAFKYLALYLVPGFLKDPFSRLAHNYVTKEFYREGKKQSVIKNKLYNPRSLNQSLVQHFEYKLEHLLKWEDHNSMWHSLESRVPFLDHNLVERTLTLPAEKIINRATTKYFLRQALKGILPEKIRNRRDKIGFGTPEDGYFDIIFCSSVIEHATVDKKDILTIQTNKEFRHLALKRQKRFAEEIRRAGKSYFVQTPYKYFPLESHSRLPVILVLLPRQLQIKIIKCFRKFWFARTTPDWNLLTVKDMKFLFPGAKILKERALFFTKSLMAIKPKKDRYGR